MRKICVILALLVGVCFGLERADIQGVMDQKVEMAVEILKDNSIPKDQKGGEIFKLFDEHIDYKLMAKISLSKYYKTLSKTDADKFDKAYEERLKASFIEKLSMYSDETMQILGLKTINEKRVVLQTLLKGQNKDYTIDFKFYPQKPDNWMIYDVDILGVSVVATYRSQFADMTENASFDEILAKLQATEVVTE